jgi:dienelactone hydrolase
VAAVTIQTARHTLADVPVLLAWPADRRPDLLPVVLWYPGYRAAAEANERELHRIASAGFVAIGVDAVGHGRRAAGDPNDLFATHPRGALGVVLDLAAATLAELPALVDALRAERIGNGGHVAVVGVSMGGYIAYRAPLTSPAVRTVVSLLGSPEWPDEPDSAHRRLDVLREVALLSITAERDESVPPAAARRLHAMLAEEGGGPAPHRYHELAGVGHLVSAERWEEAMTMIVAWLLDHHGSR